MQLVKRTLEAIDVLSSASEGLSVSELSEKLKIPMSSTHRILKCLKENNFIIQNEISKRYKIGYKVLTLCRNITQKDTLIQTAKPYMKELALKIDKTVALCILDNERVICIDYIENKDSVKFYIGIGLDTPSYSTSAGKTMQAYLELEQVKKIFKDSKVKKITQYTKTNLKDYLEELSKIKKLGYGICDEELQIGIQGIACPIFDSLNSVIASVSFTALKIENAINDNSINSLKECAKNISTALGLKG